MKKLRISRISLLHMIPAVFFPILLLYMEVIFRIFIIKTVPAITFGITLLVCVVLGSVLSLLCGLFSSKVNRILAAVFTTLIVLLFVIQTVYVNVFQTPLVLSSIGGAGQILQFMDIILKTITSNLVPILMMILLPVGAHMALVRFHIDFYRYEVKKLPFFAIPAVLPVLMIYISLSLGGKGAGGAYSIYYHESPGTLIMNRFGLIACTKNDIKALILPDSTSIESFSPVPDTLDDRETTESLAEETQETNETYVIEPNVMDIDFKGMSETEADTTYKKMNEYFSTVNPTYSNEYTGKFKDYNLIFLTAESFSPYVIDEKLTPTLYKLSHEGFVFNNFYNPVWGVSTSDGEYVNCLGLIPKSGVWSMSKSSNNWLPFTMGNQFLMQDYDTFAYHNHSYDYYDRDSSHPNLGYTYKGYGNGLDITYMWPESDLEMMQLTIPDYIKSDHFSIYYMTVSGHMPYVWGSNAMSLKHKEAVADLPYSDTNKAYIACNMELDQALEYLLDQLEAAGKLDNTFIVMGSDHYPYGLETDQLNELAGHEVERNFELYKSTLIMWNAKMAREEEAVIVDKYCSSLDILPTISNLMGLEYDSRLMMGRDILSDSTPLVIFSNKSWITNRAKYNSQTGEVTPINKGDTITDAYVQAINQQIANKFTFSTYVLDSNYYEYLFGRPDLTKETASETEAEIDTNSQTQ